MSTLEQTVAFLAHVLPREGYYVAFVQATKRHIFCDSIDRLANSILEQDAAGHTVYHGCASFVGRTKRTQANAHGARSLWSDIDVGDNKGYGDVYEAAQAVEVFCKKTELPTPLYVGSGYGLHIYWPLVETLDPETWRRYATGLKALCHAHGLKADPVRTADIASILRTPGTHNRKNGLIREVQCGPLVGHYPIERFGRLLDANGNIPVRTRTPAPKIANALCQIYSDEPHYGNTIARSCKQVGALRASRGRLPEPQWYAALGVLAFCEDGDECAHEWSSGHEKYTPKETNERLTRARRLTGATTCEKFHDLDPQTCEACPHWGKIKSPISLGFQKEVAGGETQKTASVGKGDKSKAVDELPQLPHDFYWSKTNALITRTEARGGNGVDIVISSYPIYLDAIQTGEVRGEFNFIFRQYIPSRGWNELSIPAKVLFGAQAASELGNLGANIHDHNSFIRYVRGAIDLHYRTRRLTMRYDQFGWKEKDTSFLYGLDLYSATGTERVVGNDELQLRCREEWLGPCEGGSLERWQQTINALFAVGCEPQSVALLASFAAPLLRFQERDEGGAIIHLVTHESGTGKSTALIGAASVWGRREGLGITHDDTTISKSLTLGALGNLPVIHDELVIRDPEAIRSFVMSFTEGRGKMRATREGTIRHSASTWQTLLLSAANTSLVDVLSLTNNREAAAMRIMEFRLNIPEGIRHVQGDKLRKALRANSGHAGKVYIEWVVRNLPWVQATLDRITEETWTATALEPQYRFWVRTVAAISVAGLIVKQLGLVDFSIDRIKDWLLNEVKLQAAGNLKGPWAESTLAMFLNAHRDMTLSVEKPFAHGVAARIHNEPTKALAIRYEASPNRYFIACTTLREWLAKRERSYREMLAALEKSGVLINKSRQVTLGAGTDNPGGQVYCVEIDGKHQALVGVTPPVSNVVSIAKGLTP